MHAKLCEDVVLNNCYPMSKLHPLLAQHLDDCAESFFMSIMHNGFVRTMKANYKINQGDVSVIRPLVYCRESLMTEFVSEYNATRFAQWLSVFEILTFISSSGAECKVASN